MKNPNEKAIRKFTDTEIMVGIDGCHYWLGGIAPNGYGRLHIKKQSFYAHRLAYFKLKGDPGNLFVCHSCDNRMCVNPDHLFLGTIQDNNLDRDKKKRYKPGLNSDLVSLEVSEIRRLHGSGITQKDIAILFGVKQPCISRIVNNLRRTYQ